MAWVAAHQFPADFRVETCPETGEIRGRLHGPLIRREQVDDERYLVGTDARCLLHAEEILQSRSDPWRLAFVIVDFELTATLQTNVQRGIFLETAGICLLFE